MARALDLGRGLQRSEALRCSARVTIATPQQRLGLSRQGLCVKLRA
ncbi:hypothetical protein [Thiorhodococcus mannitoliphagus]|nr:hypothetical protein [Thiorhodococcus mannitoliphagus]